MKFLSLQPFVPSGSDFTRSSELFQELGFSISFEAPGYAGFEKDGCGFILQEYDMPAFAENFMLTVTVEDVQAFREMVISKELQERFGIKVGAVTNQPYGKEVNVIDIAGVCWHFVED
ncbi:hypothetical protein ECE50_005470 [Chitinophaga sp. Mgbs1]|uniref:Uncharacterized protein n=1 Tax=Chitinophaga solisilvae TaxID=1233460 RepID=A0A433W8T6_9BACT|nr:hypothetical protein [Chitinophaga solisilvae]